jgi:flagellar motor switch/type III secretory pathway protein FliN
MVQLKQAMPFTPGVLLKRQGKAGDNEARLRPLAEVMMEALSRSLSELAGLPVKTSVEQIAFPSLTTAMQVADGFSLAGDGRQVRLWHESDRSFSDFACELLLGGTGGSPSDDSAERPPSNLERKLVQLVARTTADAAATALSQLVSGLTASVENRPGKPAWRSEPEVDCAAFHILVTALDLAAELRFLFDLPACLSMLGAQQAETVRTTHTVATAEPMLRQCPFTVDVLLPSQVLDARHLLGLRPGGVIRLDATPASPVDIVFNGTTIASGRVSYSGEKTSVLLSRVVATSNAVEGQSA